MRDGGTYGFDLQQNGNLVDSPGNLERLRGLFRDGKIIGEKFGPGEPGDFANGSWHILCHLAAGAGVLTRGGSPLWVGITHKGFADEYEATVSYRVGNGIRAVRLDSAAGQDVLRVSAGLGFVEGSSCGHVLARGVKDSATAFNGWRRQDFDRRVKSREPGGTVWEHWCTTRDLRPSNKTTDSLLRAYLTSVAALGGLFVAAVARGRRSHEHPLQLCALVKAGFLSEAEATWDITPLPIPEAIQKVLYEARPADYVAAAEKLQWPEGEKPCYFMFKRGIGFWSPAASVKQDLASFKF
jgi:hypothetical protein